MATNSIPEILESLAQHRSPVRVRGASPVARSFIGARWLEFTQTQKERGKASLVLCADEDTALEFITHLRCFSEALGCPDTKTQYFPLGESPTTNFARLSVLTALSGARDIGQCVVTTLAGALQNTPTPESFIRMTLRLEVGGRVESHVALASQLTELGYLRVDPVEDPGTFTLRGDILDLFPPQLSLPVRIELFDEEIERIREYDPATQRTQPRRKKEIQEVLVPPVRNHENQGSLMEYLSQPLVIWNDELNCLQNFNQPQVSLKSMNTPACLYLDQVQLTSTETLAKQSTNFEVCPSNHHSITSNSVKSLTPWIKPLRDWGRQGFKIFIIASTQSQLERIEYLLGEHGIHCKGILGTLAEGFQWVSEGWIVISGSEILRRPDPGPIGPKPKGAPQEWSELQALSDLMAGDLIVHKDHGIGRYLNLIRLNFSGGASDFLLLEYANKDKLYLPIYRLNVIQKYVGIGGEVALDRLGSQQFLAAKMKVKTAAKKLAFDLIQLYAQRKLRSGIRFSPRDPDFIEFEEKFAFEETPDQLKAINAVLSDLESGQMMDRLVCGDVGYGKTEVALRAAFRAVSDGKQVALLVPTTLLAIQHEQTFKARMKDYPVIIESITRFKSAKEQKSILDSLKKGKVDIIIGTHRLFSGDVHFSDLGLLIIDEEHRFGVEHKEKLKTFKINTHVLTLTATPIPRTLHMSLSGLRDISLMNTPPVNRLPIRTTVSKYDESLVKRAIDFELARKGQVFYLHNRVQTIEKTATRLKKLIPSAQFVVAHGQIPEQELEEKMKSFYEKKADVLVTTTIIESGLDLPSANTILIERADTLGLAQLYQIRGRVGRGRQRGYAYLFIPSEDLISNDAMRRLEVIQRFVELGSGFSIASHDLEIRGGGDLLGPQQSGNIAAVGFDLYSELLEEAIREIQNRPLSHEETQQEPEIKTPFPAFFSEEYVPDIRQRLSLYR